MKQVYLDYAAATPVSDNALEAMSPYFQDDFYNPSALYEKSKSAHKDLDSFRHRAAISLGVKPTEIIFTAGGSEANNLALFGIARQWPDAHIISTQIEHDSVLAPLNRLEWEKNSVTYLSVDKHGRIDIKALEESIADDTVLISIMYANNEIGVVQDIRAVADLVAEIRILRHKQGRALPLYVHTDAAQATNYLDIAPHRLGVDLMTINSGKIYGPKQCGLLYVRSGLSLEPLIYGGGQERGVRSGTESLALIAGFVTALEEAVLRRKTEAERLFQTQKQVIDLIEKELPDATINGSLKYRLVNNIHLTIPGVDNEMLLYQLDEQGFMIATGSACSASDEKSSHVLHAIGLSDEDARSSIRISMGVNTTLKNMQAFVKHLKTLVH